MEGVTDFEEILDEWLIAARSLLPTVGFDKRKHVYSWLEYLKCGGSSDKSVAELKTHVEYARYLLRALEDGLIVPPFLDPPPDTCLPPLSGQLPRPVYLDVLRLVDDSVVRRREEQLLLADEEESTDSWEIKPEMFFDTMPKPTDGAYCYCCVFATEDN